MEHRQNNRRCTGLRRLGCALLICLWVVGCRMPASRPELRAIRNHGCSRTSVLTRQLVEDTTLEFTTRPFETSTHILKGFVETRFLRIRNFVQKRLVIPCLPSPKPIEPTTEISQSNHIELALQKTGAEKLRPADVRMNFDGKHALHNLEQLIDSAQHHICVLMYLWDSDSLGWGLARRLAQKAKELGKNSPSSMTVRVLVDGGGNLIHAAPKGKAVGEVNEALHWLADQPHVKVIRARNPLARFDHRKLMLVDDRIAWTGGRNFTMTSFFDYRDVSFTVEGELVHEFRKRFEQAWTRTGGEKRPESEHTIRAASHTTLKLDRANALARVIGTEYPQRELHQRLITAIEHAKHHIYIENPYVTNPHLIYKLIKARQRGVDVRIVIAKNSQSTLIDNATKPIVNRMLRAGVRVYMYPGTTHAKAATIDGVWAYVGTGNFDSLSLLRNCEIGLDISGGPIIGEIEKTMFQKDFRPEWELKHPMPVRILDHLSEIITSLM